MKELGFKLRSIGVCTFNPTFILSFHNGYDSECYSDNKNRK